MLATLLVACTGAEPTVEPVPETPEHPETPAITTDDLGKAVEQVTLVPSPVETQKALERAGIEAQLSALIKDHDLDVRNENPDNAAVRTGVVIADMLLTVKSSSKEELLAQLASVQTGMEQLDGGADILRTIDDIEDRVRGDAVTRDELLKELDELAGAVIPELEFNGQERIVPLIQAGSWLEGANLLAKAVKAAGKPEAADGLLKQPTVVAYFLTYVKTEGQARAPEAVTEKLESSLTTLKGIAEKEASLTAEDIDVVIATTDDVLALL
jgi:hypothetical protein